MAIPYLGDMNERYKQETAIEKPHNKIPFLSGAKFRVNADKSLCCTSQRPLVRIQSHLPDLNIHGYITCSSLSLPLSLSRPVPPSPSTQVPPQSSA
jgi:hypothetical protein